jgi:hypothetical protein
MRRRPIAYLPVLTLLASLALAPSAYAYNDGWGFYGATNDRVVTNAGFLVIIFFILFVFFMSLLQRSLEKRKEARKAGEKAILHDARWRGGW